MVIKLVILFWGGAVAVFDEHDEQVVELQGEYLDVVERLRRVDLSHAEILVHESLGIGERPTPAQFLGLTRADFDAAAETFTRRSNES